MTEVVSKSVDWFLYDIGARHERVNQTVHWLMFIQEQVHWDNAKSREHVTKAH